MTSLLTSIMYIVMAVLVCKVMKKLTFFKSLAVDKRGR